MGQLVCRYTGEFIGEMCLMKAIHSSSRGGGSVSGGSGGGGSGDGGSGGGSSGGGGGGGKNMLSQGKGLITSAISGGGLRGTWASRFVAPVAVATVVAEKPIRWGAVQVESS
jgi:hypothetical protein